MVHDRPAPRPQLVAATVVFIQTPTTHEVDGAVGFGLTTGAAGPLLWRDGDGDRRWRYLKKSDPVCPNQPSVADKRVAQVAMGGPK